MAASKELQVPWTREDVSKALAEKSLHQYVKQAWRVIEPDPFIDNWHIKAICDHLEAVTYGRLRNLVINIPPRFTKSLIVSVMWPSWEWGPANLAKTRWLHNSYSSGLSLRDAVKCRALIQSAWYQKRWGSRFQLTGDQNAKERYNNTANGYRVSTSVGGMGTGEGAERCVAAGTMVRTDLGDLAIEDVVSGKGTTVFCSNERQGKLEYQPILSRMTNKGRKMVEVELESGEKLCCTEDHPVFTTGRGWVAAGQLTCADEVVVA